MAHRTPALASNRIRRVLDHLEDRCVPAALVDLTTYGAEGWANGAHFRQSDAHPTGSGVIDSFVRVQARGTEAGYNTDARPLHLNENKSPTFTRSLTLGEVPVVEVGAVRYREFLLDINQKASAPLLSLDEMRLYVGAAGNLRGYDACTKKLAGLPAVYDMDSAGDVTVKMDYRLNPGSGGGDVTVLIPDAVFTGQPAEAFVYLYSKFGGRWGANAGFEEWAVRTGEGGGAGPTQTPPSSLSGYVYYDDDYDGRREADGNESMVEEFGIAGVVLRLTGTTATGELVDLYATTDENGYYAFDDLAAGTYTLTKVADPPGWEDGLNSAGSAGGQVDDWETRQVTGVDRIFDIELTAGEDGQDYNFGLMPIIMPA